MSNQALQLENNLSSKGISLNEFSLKFLFKDEAAADHSCGDVKCGASQPF